MSEQQFPPGWDEGRVKRLIAHHDARTEDQQVADDEAAQDESDHAVVSVPKDLLPAIRQLLAGRRGA